MEEEDGFSVLAATRNAIVPGGPVTVVSVCNSETSSYLSRKILVRLSCMLRPTHGQ